MEASDLVLYTISRTGTVPGRTVLQKLCYFANVKVNGDVPFKAHHFGPYSPEVAQATDRLLVFDLVAEKRVSGTLSSPWMTPDGAVITDWERRSYNLTPEGETYLCKLPKSRLQALAPVDSTIESLKSATKLNSKRISILGKVHLLVHRDGLDTSDFDGIISAATEEGWRLTRGQVVRGLKTLDTLNL